jgi:hypothetical protein
VVIDFGIKSVGLKPDLIEGSSFWAVILATSFLFWIAVWLLMSLLTNLSLLLQWCGERLGKAFVRKPGMAVYNSSSVPVSSLGARMETDLAGGPKSLMRVELELVLSIWSAARAITTGLFLIAYGLAIAISAVASMFLANPVACIVTVSVGTVLIATVEL